MSGRRFRKPRCSKRRLRGFWRISAATGRRESQYRRVSPPNPSTERRGASSWPTADPSLSTSCCSPPAPVRARFPACRSPAGGCSGSATTTTRWPSGRISVRAGMSPSPAAVSSAWSSRRRRESRAPASPFSSRRRASSCGAFPSRSRGCWRNGISRRASKSIATSMWTRFRNWRAASSHGFRTAARSPPTCWWWASAPFPIPRLRKRAGLRSRTMPKRLP